jgi:pimeloyl-ACP methyl ester carboxylesterase
MSQSRHHAVGAQGGPWTCGGADAWLGCGSAVSWRVAAPLLAQDHTVIVPDMRGNGDSEKPSSLAGADGLPMGGYGTG